MTPTLHGAPLSPFVRKVRFALEYKQQPYESKMVVPYATPEEYKALNPLRRVPALTIGDDITLADSAVICHFLDDYFPETPTLPDTPYLSARCKWLEKYADYELAPHTTFSIFFQNIVAPLSGKAPDHERIKAAINEKLPPHFDYLEGELKNAFFLGDKPCLADFAICSQLISMAHGGEYIDAERWPNLADWYTRMTAMPFIAAMIDQEKAAITKLQGQ